MAQPIKQKNFQEKNKSKGSRQSFQKTPLNSNSNFKAAKIFEKTKKEGLTTRDLTRLLSGSKNFLGVYAADQIPVIVDTGLPVFFIVNFDTSNQPGSHWVCFRLGSSTLEIFDSLGFSPFRWNSFPRQIIAFLLRYRYTHKFCGTPKLQGENSFTCGLYCIYFILSRANLSFKQCLQIFSPNYSYNDLLVLEKIKKFF